MPRHQQRVWDGSDLTGRRVLVRCYHGLGDTIQFIRLMPMLAARAAKVTLWVQPALMDLLEGMPGVDCFLGLHDGAPECEFDVDIEIMELAHAFRLTPGALPAGVPYLPRPARRPYRQPDLAVGIVWRAGDWDAHRSIPPRLLLPLAELPGVALHILQRGEAVKEAPAGLGVLAGSDDVLEAARIMAALDLIVTVDSMPAHLAGALGLPVWTLLHAHADWRWMNERSDTPWYPTMRLFRQQRPGDWEAVITSVARALSQLVNTRSDETA